MTARLVAAGYLLVYAGITLAGLVHGRRRLRYRVDAWITRFFTVSWLTGIVAYVAGGATAPLLLALRWLFFPALIEESAQVTVSIRDEEQDPEISRAVEWPMAVLAAVVLIGPAIAIHWSLLWGDTPVKLMGPAVAGAVLAGVVLGTRLPRLEKTPVELAREELAAWLAFPTELGRAPDEIHLLDRRKRSWPGHEEAVDCFLFRFRHGSEWSVGLVGPVTFALAEVKPGASVEEIYGAYERWHREELDPLLRDAATGPREGES